MDQPGQINVLGLQNGHLHCCYLTPVCRWIFKGKEVLAGECFTYGYVLLSGPCKGLTGQYNVN